MVLRQGFQRSLLLLALGSLLLLVPVIIAQIFLSSAHRLSSDLARPNYAAHVRPPSSVERPLPDGLQALLGEEVNKTDTVPRVFLTRLPDTLPDLSNAAERKRVFTLTMLPLILRANELILENRKRTERLKARLDAGEALAPSEQAWLKDIFKKYRVSGKGFAEERFTVLLRRQDVIPPSLALAQAAMESGWGTSYFSQTGNALFGEWVWGEEKGILPRGREEGKTHRIKSFDYLLDSVRSYMTNLNRHPVYRGLRDRRAELRRHNLPVTGAALAPALVRYSERGADYVSDILSIITYNGFDGLDNARLISA